MLMYLSIILIKFLKKFKWLILCFPVKLKYVWQFLGHIWPGDQADSQPELSHSVWARPGPHKTVSLLTGCGPHLGQRKLFVSVFSVWASFGPGTQPELCQNQSKGAARRLARQIFLSGISVMDRSESRIYANRNSL